MLEEIHALEKKVKNGRRDKALLPLFQSAPDGQKVGKLE
jgi:hypothetical protein